MKIPFHKPCMTGDEASAASDVVLSGWTTMGEKTLMFERLFSKYLGGGCAVAVNSCTSALHLSLIAAGIQPGDRVILPAMTFASTASVVIHSGGVPLLADIDFDTHCISPDSAESLVSPDVKFIIPVHYSGNTCDIRAIETLADGHALKIIHDAAHAFPSFYNGRPLGSYRDLTCFSFYSTKTLSAGEGGMIVTDNEEWAERLRTLRLHGISRDAWKRYTDEGGWEYDLMEPGYKYNPTDITSAIAIEQLKKTDEMLQSRKKTAEFYNRFFENVPGLIPYKTRAGVDSSWHLYPLKLELEALKIDRNRFINELKDAGVGTSVHFIPLYRFSYYRDAGFSADTYPVCEDVFRRQISLPIYPSMTDDEKAYVAGTVKSVAVRHRR